MKRNLFNSLTLILVFVCVHSFGQTPLFNIHWSTKYQHTDTDNFSNESRKIVVNPNTGHSYVLADVTSELDMQGNPTANAYHYVVIIQYDETGNFVNSHQVDVGQHTAIGLNFLSGFGLEMDAAGNVFAGFMSYDATSDYDVNILKLSPSLTPLWSYKFNPLTDDKGIDLKVTAGGVAFAIVKSTAGGTSVRQRVIKAVAGGNFTNVLYNFNQFNDNLLSLALDAASNVYVTGFRVESGIKSILVASISAIGNLRWIQIDNCGTNSGDDIGKHIVVGADGNIYMTGSSTGTVQHGVDVVVMKFAAATGKKAWDSFINYTLSDGGFFVSCPNPAGVFVAWSAGNYVYVDQLYASNGNQGRRASYIPNLTGPVSTRVGISISDMKVSPNNIIYLTGTVDAKNTANLPFNAVYLIKINFAARGNSRIEAIVNADGTHPVSLKSTSISLDQVHENVLWTFDATKTHNTHLQEEINIANLSDARTFRIKNDDLVPQIYAVTDQTNNIVIFNSNEPISEVELTNLSGQLVKEKQLSGNNSYTASLDVQSLPSGIYIAVINHPNGYRNTVKIFID